LEFKITVYVPGSQTQGWTGTSHPEHVFVVTILDASVAGACADNIPVATVDRYINLGEVVQATVQT
jgi:hypothetical protein